MARDWLSDALGDGPAAAEGNAVADVSGPSVGRGSGRTPGRLPRRAHRDRTPERRPTDPAGGVGE